MVYLYTQTPEFFSQICEEIRLFVDIRRIEEIKTDEIGWDGLFILHYFKITDGRAASLTKIYEDGIAQGEYEYSCVLGDGELEKKRSAKRAVKISAYRALSAKFKKRMPWGSLTGIRPTKLLRDSTARHGEKEAKRLFLEEFDVSRKKYEFAKEINEVQAPLLPDSSNDIDIYIGIPFCITRCAYCSFASNTPDVFPMAEDKYTHALLKELDTAKEMIESRRVRSVYIGGGTPTAISEKHLEMVLQAAAELRGGEFTVEAGRPDTITKSKLDIIKRFSAERISVNAQSLKDETLIRIGRQHTAQEFFDAFALAKQAGFESINVDVIAGLPGETKQDLLSTLRQITALEPGNITLHTLAVKRASKFAEQNMGAFPTSSQMLEAIEEAQEMLKGCGYKPYYMYRQKYMKGSLENVGYSKHGRECLYNIDNMEDACSVAAFGAGAISKRIFTGSTDDIRIERAANVKDLREYISRTHEMIERKRALF